MADAFHEVLFPLDVAFGSSGGPERRTEIVVLGSGREERNARWAGARRRYNAGYGVKSLDDLHAVIDFFEERRGRLTGFRFRDRADWKSCAPGATPAADDQPIGTGDGAAKTFQLAKTYGVGLSPYRRVIDKPVAGSVRVAVGGAELGAGDFTVDPATGLVTLGTAPSGGAVVTAGYSFDVPVRFDTDRLEISLVAFDAGDIPDIPLVEIVP